MVLRCSLPPVVAVLGTVGFVAGGAVLAARKAAYEVRTLLKHPAANGRQVALLTAVQSSGQLPPPDCCPGHWPLVQMSQSAGSAAPKPQKRPRLKPMLAKEQQPSVVPPPTAESVDEVQQ